MWRRRDAKVVIEREANVEEGVVKASIRVPTMRPDCVIQKVAHGI